MDNWDNRMKRKGFRPSEKAGSPSDSNQRKDSNVNEMQTMQVRRVEAVPVPARSMLFSNAPAGVGKSPQAGPSMMELIFSVLRFKWTILAIFILVSVPVIAAIWTQVVPQYRARGELRIEPTKPYLVYRTEESGARPFYESFVNTQVSVMRSPTVLARVLDQDDVKNTHWFENPPQALKQRLLGNPADLPEARLRKALSVRPRRGTEILDVSFTDASAKDAQIIVNAVLNQYLKYILEASDEESEALYAKLLEQYNELKTEIDLKQTFLANLRKELKTAEPQELITAMRMALVQKEARLKDLKNRITIIEKGIEQAELAGSNGVAVGGGLGGGPDYEMDPEWRALNENVRAARQQLITTRFKPAHPSYSDLEHAVEYARETLRQRQAQLDRQWRDRIQDEINLTPQAPTATNVTVNMPGAIPSEILYDSVEGVTLEGRLALAQEEERQLSAEVGKEQAEFNKLIEKAQEYDNITAQLLEKRQSFDAVRQRKEQKDMERNVPDSMSISILMKAAVPNEPDSDRRVVFTAMVLFMGLGMGGGAAFLRANRNQTIYAPKDMPPTMQAPFLGYIPLTRIKRSLGKSLHDEVQKIRDDKIESVRLVRTALLSRLGGKKSAAVLIASATEGTGKSTFTVMLGKSLAQSGKRVIMVDADLRRMTLSKRFGLAGEPGFMESLRSKSVNQQHIFSTETTGLNILAAGMPNSDGSAFEGTANGAFKACLDQLRRHFDFIILDSSPILPVADATILSSQVDGTIMVERELVSKRANVVDALERLDSAGGELMGTVFVGSREHGKYGYGYGYGYSYSKKQYS